MGTLSFSFHCPWDHQHRYLGKKVSFLKDIVMVGVEWAFGTVVKSLLLTPAPQTEVLGFKFRLCFQCTSCWGTLGGGVWAAGDASILGSLPPTGETRMQIVAPGFSMAQPWLLRVFVE